MKLATMDRLFWTAFGVGEVALLYLLVLAANSGCDGAQGGIAGRLVLLAGMGLPAGVFATSETDVERRFCLIGVLLLLALAVILLVLPKGCAG